MTDYAFTVIHDDSISACLSIEKSNILEIGNKMEAIHDEAYMNGYNWEAFFNHYLAKKHPEILQGMESDPEAGFYAVYFDLTEDNKLKAQNFVKIMKDLIENEEKIYQFVKAEKDNIAWD